MTAPISSTGQRAERALSSSHEFCNLLAKARQYKAPGYWEGSAFRSHPCGLIVGTIKLTNFWHTDNLCSIEITDGAGWNVKDICREPCANGDPHPRAIEGTALKVWRTGQWTDAVYEEQLRTRILAILTSAAEHIEKAEAAERQRSEKDAAERRVRAEEVRRAAIHAATGGADGVKGGGHGSR
jgi:hypothetical protein